MKFSLPAFSVVFVAVIISGVASAIDGTFTSRRVTMGFVNHGGMWGDILFMSLATGLAFPYLLKNRIVLVSCLSLSLLVTAIAHIHWARSIRHDGTTGHLYHITESGPRYSDLTVAGWMHVLVMLILLTVTFLYVVSPMPAKVVLALSLLLTAHVFLAMAQPGWYCTGKLWAWSNFLSPLIATALIWAIAVSKIQLPKGQL